MTMETVFCLEKDECCLVVEKQDSRIIRMGERIVIEEKEYTVWW